MRQSFKIKQADVTYVATLKTPAFGMLSSGFGFAPIYSAFVKYGAKLADIRLEGQPISPGDVSVQCSLLTLGTIVRFRLDRIEVWSNGLPKADLPTLAEDARRAFSEMSPNTLVETQSVGIGVHGEIGEGGLPAWLVSHVPSVLDGTPTLRPAGMVFTASLGEASEATIIIERSLVVDNATFIRITCTFPGSVAEREACRQAAGFFQTALGRLGLDLA